MLENGPEKSLDRFEQIIEGHDESEVRWLITLLPEWRADGKKIEAIRRDWKDRTEKAMEESAPELRPALASLLSVLEARP